MKDTATEHQTEADLKGDTQSPSETRTEFRLESLPEAKKENKPSASKPQTREQRFLKYALIALFAAITIYLLYRVMNLWVTP